MIKYYCDECKREFNLSEDIVYKITVMNKLPGEDSRLVGTEHLCGYCYRNILKTMRDNTRNN